MNNQIRAAIIKLFGNHTSRSQDWLVSEVRSLGLVDEDGREVVRTLGLMKDKGELEELSIGVFRLTLTAVEAEAPLLQQINRFLVANWIALTALAVSIIVALFK